MSFLDYSEDALVEKPAIQLLESLGWTALNAYGEFEHGVSSLGRETKAEVILTTRLRQKLLDLNPEASPEAVHAAIEELTRDRSRLSPAAANRAVYHLLKNGVRVEVADPDGATGGVEFLRVIDWESPANNDFLLCSQFWVTGEMHTRRADLVGFVNGLPLLLIELKAVHRRLETAYSGNLRDYKDTIPQLFWANALIILSNGSRSRVGSLTAGWEHFAEWKRVDDVPSCSTLYLDKPMRNHTLMQTIARANRVYAGKVSGLIVDYAGVFRSLEKALAIYGAPGQGGGDKPVEDKAALAAALRRAIDAADGLCRQQGLSLAAIRAAEGFERIERIERLDDAVDALVGSDEIKRRFLSLAQTVQRLYKALLPDPPAQDFGTEIAPIEVIGDKIRALTPPADISLVMSQVESLLDRSIATEGYLIREQGDEAERWVDLSNVDFAKLAERLNAEEQRALAEQLSEDLFEEKAGVVFQHVYETYYGGGGSVYAQTA